MKRYRIYCGPTVVERAAENLAAAGITVDVIGVMHVYIRSEKHPMDLVRLLKMSGFTWKDFQFLGVSR